MIHVVAGPGAGARLVTCTECDGPLRRATARTTRYEEPLRLNPEVHPPFCMHCAWCGSLIYRPPSGRLCLEHPVCCPRTRHDGTVQAGIVGRFLTKLGLELTDAGWDALGEEIDVCGHHGVPVPGVLVQLIGGGPELVREIAIRRS